MTDAFALPVMQLPGCGTLVGPLGFAIFSHDKKYRYALSREWGMGSERRYVAYIGSNPSTANHETNDMTIKKEIGFSKMLGFNGLLKINLGALVSTDPRGLLASDDCVGPQNALAMKLVIEQAALVVVAWGGLDNRVWAKFRGSVELVKSLKGVKCLGRTKTGAPNHTSRLGYKAKLEDWP